MLGRVFDVGEKALVTGARSSGWGGGENVKKGAIWICSGRLADSSNALSMSRLL